MALFGSNTAANLTAPGMGAESGPSELPSANSSSALSDAELIARVLNGERSLFALLMRRYNQRLFRAARSIVHNETEAEDVVQDAWLRAFQHLGQFKGDSQFSTWVTRIAVNEALAQLRQSRRTEEWDAMEDAARSQIERKAAVTRTPEDQASLREMGNLLEHAVDKLPPIYRSVFVLRQVEELPTAEVATLLNITEDTVKTRLTRSRSMLRQWLTQAFSRASSQLYSFDGPRCDRIVAYVMARVLNS